MDIPAQPHALSIQDALTALTTNRNGLSTEEANNRLSTYGLNHLPAIRRTSALIRFLAQLKNALIYVLLGSATLTAALGYFADTAVIITVVIVNAIIGFVQEDRAEQAMNAVRNMLADHTSVLRDGQRVRIDSIEIVPGDIVLLEAGDRIPADLRLLEAFGLRTEEALLTGESLPVEKSTQPVSAETPLGDRFCMAFSGTFVTAGIGRGLVTATGSSTELGKISKMLAQVQPLRTPLTEQMDRFARWLTAAILLVAVLLLVHGYFYSHLPFVELFMAVVGLSVAAIPEGLPAILTITLAVAVRTMAKRNAIVRRLPAIETLGSVSVICTDKTGTLTCNEMMVTTAVTADCVYSVSGRGYAPDGILTEGEQRIDAASNEVLLYLSRAASLCNDAVRPPVDATEWRVDGDPMEGALLAFAGKIMVDKMQPFSGWLRIATIPFDSQTRYMATLHSEHGKQALIHVKGAPEHILGMCITQKLINGQEIPLDIDRWTDIANTVALQGQRVLALAYRTAPLNQVDFDRTTFEGQLVLL